MVSAIQRPQTNSLRYRKQNYGATLRRTLSLLDLSTETRDSRGKLSRIDWLLDVSLVAGSEGLHAIFISHVGGQRRRGNVAALFGRKSSHQLDQGQAIVAGHAQIRHQHIRFP